jgi:type IV secretory pathway TrbD component
VSAAYESAIQDLERFQSRARKYTIAAAVAVVLGGVLTSATGAEVWLWIGFGLAMSWVVTVLVVITVLYRRASRQIMRDYDEFLKELDDDA